MSINTYHPGTTVRLSMAFTTAAGAADPTTVTAWVRDPQGTETTYTYAGATVIRDSLGNFHVDVLCDKPGDWYYGFIGTGAVSFSDETKFVGAWSAKSGYGG